MFLPLFGQHTEAETKMADISQTLFSKAFSWMKMYDFRSIFHWRFFPEVQINNSPSLVQIMAWCRPGVKPLSEPLMVRLLPHPRWRIYASLGLDDFTECFSISPSVYAYAIAALFRADCYEVAGDFMCSYSLAQFRFTGTDVTAKNSTISQIPQCTIPISHNVSFRSDNIAWLYYGPYLAHGLTTADCSIVCGY